MILKPSCNCSVVCGQARANSRQSKLILFLSYLIVIDRAAVSGEISGAVVNGRQNRSPSDAHVFFKQHLEVLLLERSYREGNSLSLLFDRANHLLVIKNPAIKQLSGLAFCDNLFTFGLSIG